MAILHESKPKIKRRQKNSTKMEKRFMNVAAVATRRRIFITVRAPLPHPPGADPSIPAPRAQVILDGKTDEQRAENPTLDNSGLPTDTEGHRNVRYRLTKRERAEKLRLRETRWATRMQGLRKIFSQPVEYFAKFFYNPPPPPPTPKTFDSIFRPRQIVPPAVEENVVPPATPPNQVYEQPSAPADVPQVDHIHHHLPHTLVDQAYAEQSLVEQSSVTQEHFITQTVDQPFVQQPSVEQTFTNQAFVSQPTGERSHQFQHSPSHLSTSTPTHTSGGYSEPVYHQTAPCRSGNMGYDADMEDVEEDGPSQSYTAQVHAQNQAAYEQQSYASQTQPSSMAYQTQDYSQTHAPSTAPPPYSQNLDNGYANAYNVSQTQQPQQYFYSPSVATAPAVPSWNVDINANAQYYQQAPQQYSQPTSLQPQVAAPPPKAESPPPPPPAEPSSPVYTPEERRAWNEKMRKIWADEPPKSKPWVLSTSASTITMPSQSLGARKSSGIKASASSPSSSTVKGDREIRPLPPVRARATRSQASGASAQGSGTSKATKGTWRVPGPESSIEDIEAVVPDATTKKQKKRRRAAAAETSEPTSSRKRKEAVVIESDADQEIDDSLLRRSKRSKTSAQPKEELLAESSRRTRAATSSRGGESTSASKRESTAAAKRESTTATKRESRTRSKMPSRTRVRAPVEGESSEKWDIPVVGSLLRAFGIRR